MSGATGAGGQLNIGGVFESTTEIYKKSFGTVWIVALILMIPTGIIVGLSDGNWLLSILGSLVQLVATAWLTGSVVRIVQDVEADGRVDLSVGEVLGSVTAILVPIILLSLVTGILTTIGFFLCVIPGIFLAIYWIASVPSLVVENLGVFDSMSRSADLTEGNRMRILGVGILIFVIYAVAFILGGILAAINPIVGIIGFIVIGVLLYPYISIISAVLYFRLRELKEGIVGAVVVEETVIVEETGPGTPPAV